MNQQAETIVFGGGGGEHPSLLMWPNPGKDSTPLVISGLKYGHSVYALAISPNASRIAAGTKAGFLQVHALTNGKAVQNSSALFEVYHRPFVSGLAFLTDDILASCSLEGNIKLWSVSGKERLADFSAHSGGVVSLCQIGSLALASIGKDAVLRIWDMDSLKQQFESHPFILPGIRTLTSLDYNVASGLLLHPSGNGEVHIYDPADGFALRRVRAHDGDFCALSCGSEYVITAGLADTKIKLWPASMEEHLAEISAPLGIWSVGWAGVDSIVTAYTDGSSQIWRLDGRLSPGPRFNGLNLRTIIGLPAEIISRCRIKAGQQWRNEKLAKAKDIITNSDSSKELANIVNELSDNNFTVEASMLLADAARVQDKPLWELEVLLALTGALDGSKAVLPVLYALAVLLRRINEPKLAMDYFQKIMQIEKNFSDVSQQIEELKYDPFMKLTFENDIRGDLIQKERFLQEIEKYTILNKKFLWSAVIETGEMHDCRVCLRGSDITHSISRAVEKYKESVCSVELRQVSLYTGKKLSEIPCVYIQSTKKIMPIAVGLEIYSDAGGTGFIPHGIFDIKQLDIPSEIPANEHNRQVEEVWKNICNCDDAKAWLNNICHISFEAVKGLIGARSDTVY